MATNRDDQAWRQVGPAFDAITQAVAELAARWVREGRYPSVDEAIDQAMNVYAVALQRTAPHVVRAAFAEFLQALEDGRLS